MIVFLSTAIKAFGDEGGIRTLEGEISPYKISNLGHSTCSATSSYLVGNDGVEPSVSYSPTAYKAAALTAELIPHGTPEEI